MFSFPSLATAAASSADSFVIAHVRPLRVSVRFLMVRVSVHFDSECFCLTVAVFGSCLLTMSVPLLCSVALARVGLDPSVTRICDFLQIHFLQTKFQDGSYLLGPYFAIMYVLYVTLLF